MDEMKNDIIRAALEYVKVVFRDDFSGHDFYHTYRVYQTASRIAAEEDADAFEVELSAILHDVDDRKLSPETHEKKSRAVLFMKKFDLPEDLIARVCRNIEEVSFAGGNTVTPGSLEGRIAQDADRLDAMGAIGIARAFAYGGHAGRPIVDPEIPPLQNMSREDYVNRPSTSINHFYEKLFLLKDRINTDSARRIANERHAFMEAFVDEFRAETSL
jgi:uncharacterized protein